MKTIVPTRIRGNKPFYKHINCILYASFMRLVFASMTLKENESFYKCNIHIFHAFSVRSNPLTT